MGSSSVGMPWYVGYAPNVHPAHPAHPALIQIVPSGVCLFLITQSIASNLHEVQDLTEIRNVEKEDRMISDGAEDGVV